VRFSGSEIFDLFAALFSFKKVDIFTCQKTTGKNTDIYNADKNVLKNHS
jgi:hypothetical protein